MQEQFINTLTTTTFSKFNYKDTVTGKIRVVSPIGFNQETKPVMNTLINYDLSSYSTNADCEKYLSTYEVKTLTYSFLSLKKSLSYMFCNSRDDIDYEVYNFFLANDGVLYNINLKKNHYIIDEVNKFIINADVDCNFTFEEINLYLFFEKNTPKLFIVKDKVCNGMIDLNINNLEFIFNNTNAFIQKSETYIIN